MKRVHTIFQTMREELGRTSADNLENLRSKGYKVVYLPMDFKNNKINK